MFAMHVALLYILDFILFTFIVILLKKATKTKHACALTFLDRLYPTAFGLPLELQVNGNTYDDFYLCPVILIIELSESFISIYHIHII